MPSIPEIRSEIESTKDHLSQTVSELEDRFTELRDWRTAVTRYPITSLLISIGVGYLLGSGTKAVKQGGSQLRGMVVTAATAYVVQKAQETLKAELHQKPILPNAINN